MTNGNDSPKHALITGGTDGIGKEIARRLALLGVQILIVGRDLAKGKRAELELRESSGNRNVDFFPADLSLIREAQRVASEVRRRFSTLHYLVHSAGLVRGHHQLTEEGVESNFAINYLSRFALTNSLLPLLQYSGYPGEAARILIVSGADQHGKIYFDDVNLTSNFNVIRMLRQVCHANDVFTLELARRLATQGQPRVTVTNLKVGVVKTNTRNRPLLRAEEFEGVSGALFLLINKFKQIVALPSVKDPRVSKRLWELSEAKAGQPVEVYQ